MKDEKINFCRWRSPRGLWLPYLIVAIAFLAMFVLAVIPDKTVIEYSLMVAYTLVVAGWIIAVLSKGKNIKIMLTLAVIGLMLTIATSELSFIVLMEIIILWLMIAAGLSKLQDYLCSKRIEN